GMGAVDYRTGTSGCPAGDDARVLPRDDVGHAVTDVPADLHVPRAGPVLVPPLDGLERGALAACPLFGAKVLVVPPPNHPLANPAILLAVVATSRSLAGWVDVSQAKH